MKIAVVGAGNAGSFTALHFAYYGNQLSSKPEVELIYDPDVPAEPVGQGTVLIAPDLLWRALNWNWNNNFIHATPKTGILYENWGELNSEIFHPFPGNNMAMHYSPKLVQEYILNSNLFKVTEKKIDNMDEIDADLIFDCRGKPKDFSDYTTIVNPTNSAILGKPKWDTTKVPWTRAVATEDGWTFVIPSPEISSAHPCSVGYLYNDEITSDEQAIENFPKYFDVEVTRTLKYKSYLANKIIDGRVIKNGNRLFFLEPLEASAVNAYLDTAKCIFDVLDGKSTFFIAEQRIRSNIQRIGNFVLYHYQHGSVYDSKFWNYAKSLKVEDPVMDQIFDYCSRHNDKECRSAEGLYAQWNMWCFKTWHNGVTKKIASGDLGR